MTRLPALRFVVAMAALVSLARPATPSLTAYALNGASWGQTAVNYFINPVNLDLPQDAVIQAVRVGADAWFSQAGVNFRFVYSGTSTITTNTMDSTNVVMFRNASSGSAIATTYTWYSGSQLIDADMVFWDGAFLFFTGSSGCSSGFYIEDIATHEFGHALGLGHSAATDATMYPSVSYCNMGNRTLSADDISGVRSLYALPTAPAPSAPTGVHRIG